MADAKAAPPASKGAGSGGSPADPYRQYRYRITIAEGGIIGHFTSCSGIKMRTERLSYAEGGQDGRIRQMVGPTSYEPVTLRSGFISNDSLGLWTWMENTRRFHRDKRSVMLDYLGADDGDVFGYVLEEAWICGWDGGEMDALRREYAVFSVSLAYDAVSLGRR